MPQKYSIFWIIFQIFLQPGAVQLSIYIHVHQFSMILPFWLFIFIFLRASPAAFQTKESQIKALVLNSQVLQNGKPGGWLVLEYATHGHCDALMPGECGHIFSHAIIRFSGGGLWTSEIVLVSANEE